jgi:HEAT repeat protein
LLALLKRFGAGGVALLGEAVRHWEIESPIHLAAIEVLGVSKEASAVDPLSRLVKEGRPEARVAAARALGGIGDRTAAPVLIEALDDYTWEVRAQAARSLGRLRSAEAAPRLVARLNDRIWWVRHHAGYALGAIGIEGRLALDAVVRSATDRFAVDMAEEVLESLKWEREGGTGRVA